MSESCAYLVSRYPGITHTFIVGEVQGLRAEGVRVETASIRRVPDAQVLSEEHRTERERTRVIVPPSVGQLLGAHGRALARSPRAYLATLAQALRGAHAGGRARMWQLFYFVEAILLWRWMRQRELHHVHVHHANVGSDVAMLACAFARRTGLPWTWSLTIHGPTELLDMEAHKIALKAADAAAVVCTSDWSRSQVAAVASGNLHTIHSGIDVDAFAPADRGAHAGFEVLCVAGLSRRKGVDVLLDGFAQVLEQVPGARLTVAGDGTEAAALRAQADRLGITASVEFAGAVGYDRVPELYRQADAFCLPSFAEGVPTVLQEAMASGLPVVATAVGGVAELVDDIVVAPARADLLAHALVRLARDPELRADLGRRGREQVVSRFSSRGHAAQLHALLAPFLAD
jgi:glycosyltransferase involved in cell wall biosynthesis